MKFKNKKKKEKIEFLFHTRREEDIIENSHRLSMLPRCLSFYGQYFSLPVFIFPSHSHSLRFHIVNARLRARQCSS